MKFYIQTLCASIFAASATLGNAAEDIPTVAAENGSFNTLVDALTAANLVDTLKGDGPFTVFAPTDGAFAALPAGTLDCLLKEENKQALTNVLLYHVADGNVPSSALTDGQMIQTKLDGAKVEVDLSNGVKINEATVTSPNVFTSNGIIHIIDQVLVPSSLTVCVGLVDIPTTATNAGFDTLVTALSAAELVPTLSGPGPFTVFAPTDDAFDALPDGTLSCLLEEENKQALTDILLYHVADGSVAASDLSDGQMIQTKLDGAKVEVDLSSGVKINEATVTIPNVFTTNGIIHIIDQVLVPSSVHDCVHSHDDDDDSSTDKKSLRLMYSVVIAGVALLFTAV